MLLRDSFDTAVRDVTADVPALLDAARREGAGIRRRRRAVAVLGTTAAAAVLAVSAVAVLPDGEPPTTSDAGVTSAPLTERGPLSGETAPITGRGAVAALVDAVDQVADGTFTDLSGAELGVGDASARFLFEPDAGGPATDVFLNLQRLPRDADPATCEGDYIRYRDCAVRPLPGGDTLRTYTDVESGGSAYVRHVAEVRSPSRGLRVVLGSSNTQDGDTGLAGVAPALSTEQLVQAVSQPWWRLKQLPVEYVEAGERLPAYRDHGAN